MTQPTIINQESKISTQARLARRNARRLKQMIRYRRASLAGVPIFFANSFPKSGTHLLTQVLIGFTRIGPAVDSGMPAVVTFEGHTGRARPTSEILNDLKRLKPADIAYGHLHNFPEVADFICRDGFIPYFILRDPRDVVVSHAFYVTEMQTQHIHHNFYQNVLEDENERLHTSIVGIASENDYGGPSLPNINDRFTPYLGWLDRPEVLTLHYENFVTQRQQTLSTILDHAVLRGFVLECARETALRILDESINPRSSPTYRSGKIGGWQSAFNEDHKRSFKNVSGDLLIRLGYEENQNW